MQDFIAFLGQLGPVEEAKTRKEREHTVLAACKSIAKMVDLPASRFAKRGRDVALPILAHRMRAYLNTYGDWLLAIPSLYLSTEPKDKKKLRKLLNDFTHLVYLANCLKIETEEELVKRIQFSKTLKELDALEKGRTIQSKTISSLAERLQAANDRQGTSDKTKRKFERLIKSELQKKRAYLEKKQRADTVATWLTAIVSSLGVGLVSGIAMVLIMPLIWPVIPVGAYIGALCGFTLFGSFTEFFVYRGYVKTFCRQCVRGFFTSIDNHIYKREAEKYLKKDHVTQHDLSKHDKARLRKKFIRERIIKRVLVVCCIPLALGGCRLYGLYFRKSLRYCHCWVW